MPILNKDPLKAINLLEKASFYYFYGSNNNGNVSTR